MRIRERMGLQWLSALQERDLLYLLLTNSTPEAVPEEYYHSLFLEILKNNIKKKLFSSYLWPFGEDGERKCCYSGTFSSYSCTTGILNSSILAKKLEMLLHLCTAELLIYHLKSRWAFFGENRTLFKRCLAMVLGLLICTWPWCRNSCNMTWRNCSASEMCLLVDISHCWSSFLSGLYSLYQGMLVFWWCGLDLMMLFAPSPTSRGASTEPKFYVWDCYDCLFKATIWLKRMSHSLKIAWMKRSLFHLPNHFVKWFLIIWELGFRSESRFLCDPSQRHCPHGESLIMPEFLFLVLWLKPLAVKRLKWGDKHINLPSPSLSAAASVSLCISRCSFAWTIRHNHVLSMFWWNVIQTFRCLGLEVEVMLSVHMGWHAQAEQCVLCLQWRQAGQAVTVLPTTCAIRAF